METINNRSISFSKGPKETPIPPYMKEKGNKDKRSKRVPEALKRHITRDGKQKNRNNT